MTGSVAGLGRRRVQRADYAAKQSTVRKRVHAISGITVVVTDGGGTRNSGFYAAN